MKQVIPFVKDIDLNSKISDITSIALEHNLKMENNDSVVGEFIISGKFKMNDISINEQVFEKKIDFDITLDDKYDATNVQIDVDDFYYEIINEEYLRVHIDVLVDNLVYFKEPKPALKQQTEPEIVSLDDFKDELNIIEERNDDVNMSEIIDNEEVNDLNRDNKVEDIAPNLSSNFISQEEKYSMYKVHIIRENDTIDMIKEKYSVSTEELEKYNDLQNIILGTKIIIPTSNE